MPNEKVQQARQALLAFLHSNHPRFEMAIDCPIEERISFIYAIIFPGFEKVRFYWRFLIARLAYFIDYSPLKVRLYRSIGIKIGKGVFISPGVILDPHFPSLISIDDYAIIGWGTQLFTHEFTGEKYTAGRIHVGRGAVIGGLSVVRGGVTIGDNAQVASTCIVYKDVPENYCLDSIILLNRALADVYRRNYGSENASL